jgi:hypothetical protein
MLLYQLVAKWSLRSRQVVGCSNKKKAIDRDLHFSFLTTKNPFCSLHCAMMSLTKRVNGVMPLSQQAGWLRSLAPCTSTPSARPHWTDDRAHSWLYMMQERCRGRHEGHRTGEESSQSHDQRQLVSSTPLSTRPSHFCLTLPALLNRPVTNTIKAEIAQSARTMYCTDRRVLAPPLHSAHSRNSVVCAQARLPRDHAHRLGAIGQSLQTVACDREGALG